MEAFLAMVGLISGLVIGDLKYQGQVEIKKPVQEIQQKCDLKENIVTKTVYPNDVAYIVDMKQNPVKVMSLDEKQLKQYMTTKGQGSKVIKTKQSNPKTKSQDIKKK